MMPPIQIYRSSKKKGALRQGELLSDLVQIMLDIDNPDEDSIVEEKHPIAIVVTQDCDLEQDYSVRFVKPASSKHRLLKNILFCQVQKVSDILSAYPLDEVRNPGTTQKNIAKNKDERFHFLQKIPSENDLLKQGFPELIVEFKQYFTLPTEEVYRRIHQGKFQRRSQLRSPYLEHFAVRFHYYHTRIALPGDHISDR